MDVCTIVSRRSLARARVLAGTLREHHPDSTLTVLLLDGDPDEIEDFGDASSSSSRLLGLEAVVGPDHGLPAAANPPGALAIAVLSALLRTVLDAGAESVLYVDADLRLRGPLNELWALLADHEIVLVARAHTPAQAGARDQHAGAETAFCDDPSAGAFSRRVLGLRAGASATILLDAWPRYFASDADDGAAAVRAWLDGIPALVDDVGVLRDPDERLPLVEQEPEHPRADGRSSGAARADGPVADAGDPAPYAQLDDGLRLTATIRTLLVKAIAERAVTRSPFTAQGRAELYAYLSEPSERGRAAGLARLHMAIWDARADLRSGYPHIDGPDGAGFAGWLCLHGAEQEGLVPELLPPTPDLAYRDANPHIHEDEPRWGVNVAGFFTAELGVGEAARLLIAGLDAASIPALPIQGHLLPPSRRDEQFAYARIDEAAYPINILCINGDGIPVFAREAGRSFFAGRHTIALWWWEVGAPPAEWSRAYEFVDEIWVASRHIYDAVAPTAPVPVVRMTLPVVTPKAAVRTRAQLGLPEDGFLFLYVHDYHSVAARKNPLGTIEAFRRAFAPGGGAKLVLKSINADTRPQEHARVVRAAREHDDITLVDAYVTGAEKNAMIAACDCYVSLHRSEGFGLTAAEAMLLGKPVIATRYGGTLEFMDDENSYLVRWAPTNVGEGAYPYSPDGVWAEPDLDHAAALMREVFADRDGARARGQRAQRDLRARHAPAVAGEAMRQRLALIHERSRAAGAHSLNLAHLPSLGNHEAIGGVIDNPPVIGWGSGQLARLRQRFARPVANWANAYIEHQGKIDTETQNAIARIDARLREVAQTLQDQQQAQHAETLAVLRRVESELADVRSDER